MFKCECGREFDNHQSFNGHKSHCKIHQAIKYGSLDNLIANENHRHSASKTVLSKKRQDRLDKQHKADEDWVLENHVCEQCGKIMTEKYGSGRFCSMSCANKHTGTSNEIKAKIAAGVRKAHELYCSTERECELCGNIFIPDSHLRKVCYSCKPKKEKHTCRKTLFELSKRTVSKIIARMEIPCSCCGSYVQGVVWDLHHIIPKRNGGEDDIHNLTYICPNCHRIAHTDTRLLQKQLVPFDDYLKDLNLDWEDYYYYSDDLK